VLQSIGFRAATPIWSDQPSTAEKADKKNEEYNAKKDLREEAKKLRDAYEKAGSNAELAKIKSKIREYNKREKPEGIGNISLDNLIKKRAEADG
jgi:hypothetical protein